MVKSNEMKFSFTNLGRIYVVFVFSVIIIIIIIIIITTILLLIIIELTHSKTKLKNIAEMETQPVALDLFLNKKRFSIF